MAVQDYGRVIRRGKNIGEYDTFPMYDESTGISSIGKMVCRPCVSINEIEDAVREIKSSKYYEMFASAQINTVVLSWRGELVVAVNSNKEGPSGLEWCESYGIWTDTEFEKEVWVLDWL